MTNEPGADHRVTDAATSAPGGHGPAPDTARRSSDGWRRLVATFALTSAVTYGISINAFPVLVVAMADDLDTSRTAITAASTVAVLVGALVAFPVGRLLDRHGGRALMTCGSLIAVAGVMLWSRADSLASLYGAFVLIGTALAMSTYEAAFSVLVVATEERERDRAILTVTMLTGFTTFLYYPLAAWLESQIGWRDTVALLGALIAVLAVPAHFLMVPGRRAHSTRITPAPSARLGTALQSRSFWLLSVAFVAQAAATTAFMLQAVTWLRDEGHAPEVAATVPLAVGLVMVLSRFALPAARDTFGLPLVALTCFALQGAGLLVLPLVSQSLSLVVLCSAGVGLAIGVATVARPTMVADAFGTRQFASIVAVTTALIALARAGSPLIASELGDWRFLCAAGIASLIAAAALVPLIGAPPHTPPRTPPGTPPHTPQPCRAPAGAATAT